MLDKGDVDGRAAGRLRVLRAVKELLVKQRQSINLTLAIYSPPGLAPRSSTDPSETRAKFNLAMKFRK